MISMKPWQQALAYIFTGIAIALVLVLFTRPTPGKPIQLTPVVPQTYQIQVDGSVINPGVFTVPAGARVAEVIDLAGGATSPEVLTELNLARPVKDGERIVVGSDLTTNRTSEISLGLLDINQATFKDLDALPGIGEAKANAILAYRQENGHFVTIDELLKVPGISDDVFQKVKDLVMVQ